LTRRKAKVKKNTSNGANLGFEEKLWQATDKMRGIWILPKMLSGEIRVKEADRFVVGVA
jgi:hypothetical protein